MGGFIKIHRKMKEWGWYSDANTFRVFIHLLLIASYEDNEYRGIKLSAGQAVVGRKQLAKDLGISEQSVRTALNHLKSTNEITIKATNKFSVVTIEKWAEYQGCEEQPNQQINQQPNQRLTNNQPTTNHTQEIKKVRNKENIYRDVPDEIREAFMEWADMRKKIKRPLTSKKAVSRALNELNKLSSDTAEQIELIEYATFRNWQSFYPIPKEEKKGNTYSKTPEPPKYEEFKPDPVVEVEQASPEQLAEMYAKLGGCFG